MKKYEKHISHLLIVKLAKISFSANSCIVKKPYLGTNNSMRKTIVIEFVKTKLSFLLNR